MTAQADIPAVDQAIVAEAITTFFDGKFTDFFAVVVDPSSRELISMEFYEKRPDLGEIQFLKQVGWDIVVPPEAQPFAATSGLLRDQVNAFWAGWRTPDTYSALSLYQEGPLNLPMDPAARLIQPAIVVPSRNMLQYFWLPKDDAWSLYRHEFRGNQGERGSVATSRIGPAGHEPLLSSAIPIPGAEDDRSAVAWIEQTDIGIKATAMLFSGDTSESLSTPAVPFVAPVKRQRLAMHVSAGGTVSIGFVAESKIGGYVVMEVRFDFANHIFTFHPASLRLEPGSVHSACMFFSKNPHEHDSFVCALSAKGVLTVMKPGSDFVRVVREHVDPAYDFPILTSSTGRYEATRTDGELEFIMLP
jgi:hypothetical protein